MQDTQNGCMKGPHTTTGMAWIHNASIAALAHTPMIGLYYKTLSWWKSKIIFMVLDGSGVNSVG